MLTVILFILTILGIPILFILFSAPKPHSYRELHRGSPLLKIHLKDDYPSEEVFKTLKDAGIKPCFLNIN